MAIEGRKTESSLIQRLLKEPYLFSFFQAVYLIEKYSSSISDIRHVGNTGPAELESIRFKPDASLAFPVSDIVSIKKTRDFPPRFEITTSFLGLYGSDSPLPDFYTEDIIRADPEESYVKDFLDIFHHRILSLFYRCWLKYRYHIQFISEGKDEYSQRIFDLIGIGTQGTIENLKIRPVRLIRYIGLLSQKNKSALALESILSDYFDGIPVRIYQYVGRWIIIGNEDRISLGSQNSQLGINTTLGGKVFDCSGKFVVSINTLKYDDYIRFLPEGKYFQELIEIIKLFLNAPLDFDEELIIPASEVPMLCLLSSEEGAKLGRTSWLVSCKHDNNFSVVFSKDQ